MKAFLLQCRFGLSGKMNVLQQKIYRDESKIMGSNLKLAEIKKNILDNVNNGDELLAKSIKAYDEYDNNKSCKLAQENLEKNRADYLNSIAIETGATLIRSIQHHDQTAVMSARKTLINDLKPQNIAELMLIDVIVNSYLRLMVASTVCTSLMTDKDGTISLNNEIGERLKVQGKLIDYANKQFLLSLSTFKSLRQAPVNVNIKTKSAFVAQAQQFNDKTSVDEKLISSFP